MAELGSLSLEFTRLAQITGNSTYYDAIARITNEFEAYQFNTTLPGMWPIYIDASGCQTARPSHVRQPKKPKPVPKPKNGIYANPEPVAGEKGISEKEIPMLPQVGGTGKEVFDTQTKPKTPKRPAAENSSERVLDMTPKTGGTGKEVFNADAPVMPAIQKAAPDPAEKKIDMPRKMGGSGKEVYPDASKPPAAQGDSTEKKLDATPASAGASKEAPPTPKEQLHKRAGTDTAPAASATETDNCIPQGFSKPHYLREEKYTLGAMADSLYEYFPKQYLLMGGVPEAEQYARMYKSSIDVATKHVLFKPKVAGDPDILLSGDAYASSGATPRLESKSGHLQCFAGGMYALGSRALGRADDLALGRRLTDGCVWAYSAMPSGIMPETFTVTHCTNADGVQCRFSEDEWIHEFYPKVPKTHPKLPDYQENAGDEDEEDAEGPAHQYKPPQKRDVLDPHEIALNTIFDEQLPPGFTVIQDRRYILRPEAIESVFILYRITGDRSWMEKGWHMFKAVEGTTRTAIAHSAIVDVAATPDDGDGVFEFLDSMESFWLAETLKYFYLLFAEPDVVSLDQYVLNTEAHPLKRALPK